MYNSPQSPRSQVKNLGCWNISPQQRPEAHQSRSCPCQWQNNYSSPFQVRLNFPGQSMLDKRLIRVPSQRSRRHELTGQRKSPVGDRIRRQVYIVDAPGVQTRVQGAHGEGPSRFKGPSLGDVAETSDLEGHYWIVPCAGRRECLPKGLSTRGGNRLPRKAHQTGNGRSKEAIRDGVTDSWEETWRQGTLLRESGN